MAKKNFLLLSMEDNKIKKVSNVISNDSCRKILDYLSNKEATESELSEKLGIPISTVHYNLQQLMETELIESKEFHYSEKGKEVSHYRLANKYIIIAPKSTFGIKEKLKSILSVALITIVAASTIELVTKYITKGTSVGQVAVKEAAPRLAAAPMMEQAGAQASQSASIWSNIALWFFIGAVFALLVYFIASVIRKEVD